MILTRTFVFAGSVIAATAAIAIIAITPQPTVAAQTYGSRFCATSETSAEEAEWVESMTNREVALTDSLITVQVVFHVINKGEGSSNGDIPESMIQAQITAMNNAFSGGAGGANTSFRFELLGITRTTNLAWYTAAYHSPEEYAMKEALRVGDGKTLNIYTTMSPWNWGTFPWVYPNAPQHDGVVLRHETMPGGASQYFGTGDIGVHEAGHWLGLYHTYQGECSINNDFVADTAAMKPGAQSCPAPRDTCKGKNYPGNDPLNNYMTGMIDSCAFQFTSGQATRMSQMWATWRQ